MNQKRPKAAARPSSARARKAAVEPRPETNDNLTAEAGGDAALFAPDSPRSSRRRQVVAALENRAGYHFADLDLLDHALTHISALTGVRSRTGNYQRLEFLGDHVLGLVVSDVLFREFPNANEGELSKRLADLVRKETCADVARVLSLGDAIKIGPSEAGTGGRLRLAILPDVCEAFIGAIYIDGGLRPAAIFIERFWGERMRALTRPPRDPKTVLQEWAQARGLPTPVYRELERKGPHHDPEFKVAAELPGLPPADGQGRSKRAAEQAAAAAFIARQGVRVDRT